MKRSLRLLLPMFFALQGPVAGDAPPPTESPPPSPTEVKTYNSVWKLAGPVKGILWEKSLFVFEEDRWIESKRPLHKTSYDRKGNCLDYVGYGKDGSFEFQDTRKYDDRGHMIHEVWVSRKGVSKNTVYVYNAGGHLSGEEEYKPDGSLLYRKVMTYDDKGNLIERRTFTSDGIPGPTVTYRYNEQGQKLKESWLRGDGTLVRKTVFSYDEDGKLIETESSGGSVDSSGPPVKYKYDSKGRLKEKVSYNPDGSTDMMRLWKYDSQGNTTEEMWWGKKRIQAETKDSDGKIIAMSLYNDDNSLERKEVYIRDAKGNSAEEEVYNADGSLRDKYVYAYEYDSLGNWTKKTRNLVVSKEGKSRLQPCEVEYRTITYYGLDETPQDTE